MSLIFSLFFWPAAFTSMAVGAALTLALRLVGMPYRDVHRWVTAPLFGAVVRLSGSRLRVTYSPAFDRSRLSVFCQNHVNLMDGHVAAAVIPHAFCGLMNSWQFHIPIYGWLMRLSHGIPVRRGRAHKVIDDISAAARERIGLGLCVLVFPEAHRTGDGRVQPFRRGVFVMAQAANLPVVPVAVRGMFEVNRKGSFVFHPGHTIEVHVGATRETAGLDADGIAALARELGDEVSAFVGRAPEGQSQRVASPHVASEPASTR